MRKTVFLTIPVSLVLSMGCNSPQSSASPPIPEDAEMAQPSPASDSLVAARRATADSVRLARQVADRARADSVALANQTTATATAASERETAAEAVRRNTALRGEIAEMVHFDVAMATIQPNGRAALDRKVAILKANPAVRLLITGACDDRGSDQYNQALGNRRAEAVKAYLVSMGIDAGRLEHVSTGEKSPIDAGRTEAAWAKNRRAEFSIVSGDAPLAMR